MTRPALSVITPNFNSGDKLAATLASLRSQEVDCEYLILDGGSTDGSLEIAQRLAAEMPERIRVRSQPDRGIYDAMNQGITLATGRYLYFLGAGDIVLPGALKAIVERLPDNDREFVYGDANFYGKIYDGPFNWQKMAYKNVCHQAAFYGRELFDVVGAYDLKYKAWADWELNLRIFCNRKLQTRYVPVVVADFEPDGVSIRGDKQFYADHARLLQSHFGKRRFAYFVLRQAFKRWTGR